MPTSISLLLFIFLFLVWVCARLVHQEAMRHLHSIRLNFGAPYVDSAVPLFRGGAQIGSNDIAKITVRNVPYDGQQGKSAEDCFARIDVYETSTMRHVLGFDYPRWEENPKPGYHDHPSDHFPHEWNRRTLPPNGEASTINFLIKSVREAAAYGFRGRSQIVFGWRDPELKIGLGEYAMKIVVSGAGMRRPAEQWLAVNIGPSIKVAQLAKRPKSPEANISVLKRLAKRARSSSLPKSIRARLTASGSSSS
jgi:hypothetical protein